MSFKKQISEEQIQELELRAFEGEVVFLTTLEEAQEAAQRMKEAGMVGIDTETKPTFKKGVTHKVALLQLGLEDTVYMVQLIHVGLLKPIAAILNDPKIIKVGIGTRDDVRTLKRDYGCTPKNVVDLNILAKSRGFKSIGAKKLTAIVLGFRIAKGGWRSNWEHKKLTESQISYAATDAWICHQIYRALHSK